MANETDDKRAPLRGPPSAETVTDALERGRRAWPGIDLPAELYARFLGPRAAAPNDEPQHPDLFLVCAVLAGIPAAREAFESSAMKDVPKAIMRVSSAPDFVADVSADLRLSLVAENDGKPPLLERYQGTGPLRSFVMVLAMRRALDKKRRQKEVPTEQNALAELAGESASFQRVDSHEFRELFMAALKENLSVLAPRDRNVLRMHAVDGISADAIAKMYGVHRATVTRWIAGAKSSVFEETRDSLRKKLNVSPETFASFAREAVDEMDATLSSFLAETAP